VSRSDSSGGLVLVATPIGNLGDLSPRAIDALRTADLIYCEDTRRTRALLSHAGIRGAKLLTLHEHNEAEASQRAVSAASSGASVAVVTDAGMPSISDPGERVVRAAIAAGVPVTVVPGPSAMTAALVGSGLPTGRFCFEGFLPRRGGERAARLAAIAAEPRTVVIYEAPRRVAATINDLQSHCGSERPVALARELTKLHEEWWRGTLGEAEAWIAGSEPRGEWVIVLGGASPPAVEADDERIRRGLRAALADSGDRRAAVAHVAAELAVPKRRVYDLAVQLRRDEPAPPAGKHSGVRAGRA
jgi:16S rRNA (cytidine1402-2'-O)-methyltransferase